jgi:hypothetical protein
MALKGNLKDFSFLQLLNLINLANKTGTLYLERSGTTSRSVFHNGKLAFVEINNEKLSLLKILADDQVISPTQLRLLAEKLAGQPETEQGIYLVNAGYATMEQVLACLEKKYTEKFRHLFSWLEGSFLVEGARELRELEELRAEIPSLEMALKFTERPGTDISKVNLNATEWRVISYINPKNSIQQIANTVKLDEFEIRRVVYTLLQAGLVEIVRPDGLPVAIPGTSLPVKNPEANRSLVKRLIDRIRSI